MAEYRVHFDWTNSYGTKKRAVAFATAETAEQAIPMARKELAELYGIRKARFVTVFSQGPNEDEQP